MRLDGQVPGLQEAFDNRSLFLERLVGKTQNAEAATGDGPVIDEQYGAGRHGTLGQRVRQRGGLQASLKQQLVAFGN